MTKFALEAMADSFRARAGARRHRRSRSSSPGRSRQRSGRSRSRWPTASRTATGRGSTASGRFAAARSSKAAPVDLVADAVEHALTAQRPRTRYVVGRDARIRATIETVAGPRCETASTGGRCSVSETRLRSGCMRGQMMDFQLTLPHLLRRAETYYGGQGDRHPPPRQELPPLRLPRPRAAVEAARGRAAGTRPRARRPRCHALLEPLPAHGVLPRDPVRRVHAAHAQPPPAPERPRVHRVPRGRQGRDRRPEPRAAARPVPRRDPRSSTSSSSRTRTRSCSPARRPTTGATPSSTRTRRRRCATRAGRPAARRASSTRTARRSCTRSGSARRTRSGIGIGEGDVILPGRADVPRERVGLSVPGHDVRREDRLPGTAPRRGVAAGRLRPGGRDVGGRGADDLDGDPRHARRQPGPLGSLGDEGHARRRLGGAARDDRGVQRAPRPDDRARLGDDRDLARRLRPPLCRATSRRPTRRPSTTTSRSRGCRCPSSSCERATPRATRSRGTTRRWASSRSRGRGSRPRTTTRPSRPTAGRTTAGSRPATSSRIHPRGFIHIQDRSKDVIKSGGEWISSVALENALMGHPGDRRGGGDRRSRARSGTSGRWRSASCARGRPSTGDELREFLAADFAKWWLPDAFVFVDEIPKTAVGKFRKTALREMFPAAPAEAPEPSAEPAAS